MRVILVRLSALGDIVHSWPLARALKKNDPDGHLTWVVEEPFRPLVEGHPAVDQVITVATKAWRKSPVSRPTRAAVAVVKQQLRGLHADVALDAQGTLKSASITAWTRAPRRIGQARPWRREWAAGWAYTETLPGSTHHSHVVATNLALAGGLAGLSEAPEIQSPDGRWLLARCGEAAAPMLPEPPFAVLLPGAGRPSKILSVEVLAEVSRRLRDRGLGVLLAWGPGERDRAEAIAAAGGGAAAVAPPTDLAALTGLLGAATVVVGGDTGPTHLAASLGIPTLGVFLSTDWRRNGPLGARTEVVSTAVLSETVRPDRASANPGRAPSAAELILAIDRLLAEDSGSR